MLATNEGVLVLLELIASNYSINREIGLSVSVSKGFLATDGSFSCFSCFLWFFVFIGIYGYIYMFAIFLCFFRKLYICIGIYHICMVDDLIIKISKEFAEKIAEVKDAFILEELKPYFTYSSKYGIEWSQKVYLQLAEYKDFERRFEQEKEVLRKMLIEDIKEYFKFKTFGLTTGYRGLMLERDGLIKDVNKRFGVD